MINHAARCTYTPVIIKLMPQLSTTMHSNHTQQAKFIDLSAIKGSPNTKKKIKIGA